MSIVDWAMSQFDSGCDPYRFDPRKVEEVPEEGEAETLKRVAPFLPFQNPCGEPRRSAPPEETWQDDAGDWVGNQVRELADLLGIRHPDPQIDKPTQIPFEPIPID